MLQIPLLLSQQFDDFLQTKPLSNKERALYKKWLRFYWDFCHKYNHDVFHSRSLPLFLLKLQDKNQTVQQQEEAKYAFSLFFEMRTGSAPSFDKNQSNSLITEQSDKQMQVASSCNKDHVAEVNKHYGQQSSYAQVAGSISSVNNPLQSSGSSWVFVFDQLINEIKIRHYSPKTLKAYKSTIRKFQTFLKVKIIKYSHNKM